MESCTFPRTVEEMLEAGWYEKILRKVRKYNLKDILNTPEELVQDVFCQIIKSDYLSRYDPDYRPFEVYIYVLVENLMKKRGVREGTKGGKKIVNRMSLDTTVPETGIAPDTVYLDLLDLTTDPESVEEKLYVADVISATCESLKQFKAHSSVDYDGVKFDRDPLTVFKLVLAGKTVPEIAEILQTSKQFVYVLLHRIRDTEEMQQFYSDFKKTHMPASYFAEESVS